VELEASSDGQVSRDCAAKKLELGSGSRLIPAMTRRGAAYLGARMSLSIAQKRKRSTITKNVDLLRILSVELPPEALMA
jgi:hypothetical protein